MVLPPADPYTFFEEHRFLEDCQLIETQDVFDVLFQAVKDVLHSRPYEVSWPLRGNEKRRYLRTREHFSELLLPELYVLFTIDKDPPDGIITLRRVVTEADVRAGLLA